MASGAYAGAADLLTRLGEGAGPFHTACLSNTNRRHWRMMVTPGAHHLPLDRLWRRFTSFEIGAMKPSPDVYRHVEVAAAVEPREILFFDDNAANIAAAREAGWAVERIDSDGDPVKQIREKLSSEEMLKAEG